MGRQVTISLRSKRFRAVLEQRTRNESKTARKSVSMRFRSKERGTSQRSRAAKTENPVPRSFFAPKPNGNACHAG